MIGPLHHVGLTVSDLDVSLAHYRDHFGFRVISVGDVTGPVIERITGFAGAHLRIADLSAPDGRIVELIEYIVPRSQKSPLDLNDPGITHIAFEVGDVAAMYERLNANGVKCRSEPILLEDPGSIWHLARVFYSEDPDGKT
jgi:glyoxylase I family protein